MLFGIENPIAVIVNKPNTPVYYYLFQFLSKTSLLCSITKKRTQYVFFVSHTISTSFDSSERHYFRNYVLQ